jgi:hypothetical protein
VGEKLPNLKKYSQAARSGEQTFLSNGKYFSIFLYPHPLLLFVSCLVLRDENFCSLFPRNDDAAW